MALDLTARFEDKFSIATPEGCWLWDCCWAAWSAAHPIRIEPGEIDD